MLKSHVIPSLIRRFHEAMANGSNSIAIWGSGAPKREFLYVDDMADACINVMNLDRSLYELHTGPILSHINVGCGYDVTIKGFAETIAKIIGYVGNIVYDNTKPDGTPKILIDSTKLKKFGWSPKITPNEGMQLVYQDYLDQYAGDDGLSLVRP